MKVSRLEDRVRTLINWVFDIIILKTSQLASKETHSRKNLKNASEILLLSQLSWYEFHEMLFYFFWHLYKFKTVYTMWALIISESPMNKVLSFCKIWRPTKWLIQQNIDNSLIWQFQGTPVIFIFYSIMHFLLAYLSTFLC